MNHLPGPLSTDQLLTVLAQANNATAIHVTENFNIQYASDAMIAIWGKDRRVIGMPIEEALPELKGQPFIDLFREVWHKGITVSGTDTAAQLEVDGKLQTFYFDFEYRAIKDEEGKTFCILHTATDVTARLLSEQREQTLSEELRSTNEELQSANEELNATNEELVQSQVNLQEVYDDLADRDARLRNMVRQAPIGICIIRAKDLIVQEVNNAYLEIVDRPRDKMENRQIWEAVPEAASYYAPVMDEVIRSGIPFATREAEVVLIRKGEPDTVYLDFVYEPIKLVDGYVDAIMVLVIDVTDKVLSRRHISEAEERARLAINAADIGTFDLDRTTNLMKTSERFDTIFGFDHPVDRDTFSTAIHPDDNEKRLAAHAEALETGRLAYEVRVIYPDKSTHWVRVSGQVYYDDEGKAVRVIGTALDITEFKQLQQQKDDFISIASHELKTPITSLKASLQLLERMKENPSPTMLPKLIDQSTRSMHKISTLVDDLLNVSRARESQLKLNKTTFTVAEMLQSCCNHVRVLGKHDLIIEGDKTLQIHADEHSIDQVIVNLVNNAVKYAPDEREIIMTVAKEGDMAKVSITDHGPGIPADKLPYLFDRYYQAETSGFQNSGLGLGLYICAEIIRRHDGQIGVESELGKGSTFWFTVPIK